MPILRLDKYLSEMGIGTRTQVKTYIRKGRVALNGNVVKSSDTKVDSTKDMVFFDQEQIHYVSYEYYMLNKPQGVVSATTDNTCKTVIDLIETSKRKDLFPVGRLDKDTEGLLLITNDGDLAHRLLSPKKQVGKEYYAEVKGIVTEDDIVAFKEGVWLEEDFKTLPSELTILEKGAISKITLVIYEGKFHQVKRMFESVGKEVVYLKRLSMGKLELDPLLKVGEYRELSEKELLLLNE